MTRDKVNRLAEVFFARILPGLISVWAFLTLADRLAIDTYGIFSTLLGSLALLSNMLYGPINLAIVPLFSTMPTEAGRIKFKGDVIGLGLLVATMIAIFGFAISLLYSEVLILLIVLIPMGLLTLSMGLLQAQLSFWKYGLISGSQSIIFAVLVFAYTSKETSYDTILLFYALSTAFSFLSSLAFIGLSKVSLPSCSQLKRVLLIGFGLTTGTLAESMFFMGYRYLLLFSGQTVLLGQFSFLVDLAQRTVVVAINIISFAVLPKAYKVANTMDLTKFVKLLRKGALVSLLLSLFIYLSIIVISNFKIFSIFNSEQFSAIYLLVVAMGLGVNRIRKIVIDPIAVQLRTPRFIPLSYLLSGPIFLFLAYLFLLYEIEAGFYISYLSGYIAAGLLTFYWLSKQSKISMPFK